jgi:hypothetical protein
MVERARPGLPLPIAWPSLVGPFVVPLKQPITTTPAQLEQPQIQGNTNQRIPLDKIARFFDHSAENRQFAGHPPQGTRELNPRQQHRPQNQTISGENI